MLDVKETSQNQQGILTSSPPAPSSASKIAPILESIVGFFVPPWSLVRAIMDRHKFDRYLQLGAGIGSILLPGAALGGLYWYGMPEIFSNLSLGWEIAATYGAMVGISMLGRGIGFLLGSAYTVHEISPGNAATRPSTKETLKSALAFTFLGRASKTHFYASFTQNSPDSEELNSALVELDKIDYFSKSLVKPRSLLNDQSALLAISALIGTLLLTPGNIQTIIDHPQQTASFTAVLQQTRLKNIVGTNSPYDIDKQHKIFTALLNAGPHARICRGLSESCHV